MRNFPKRLATAADIRNCAQLVKLGTFEASELLDAIDSLERQNYLQCPIVSIGGDKKTVTIKYCAEAKVGTKAIVGGKTVTISAVHHENGEPIEGEEPQLESTILTISAVAPVDSKVIEITAPYTIYESLGITEEELNQIKEELANE